MRDALIRARPHGKKAFEVILQSGADAPIAKVLSKFKEFKGVDSDEKYEHVELWTSDVGRQSQVKNIPTVKAAKERKEREAKAAAEAAKAAAEAKAKQPSK